MLNLDQFVKESLQKPEHVLVTSQKSEILWARSKNSFSRS